MTGSRGLPDLLGRGKGQWPSRQVPEGGAAVVWWLPRSSRGRRLPAPRTRVWAETPAGHRCDSRSQAVVTLTASSSEGHDPSE